MSKRPLAFPLSSSTPLTLPGSPALERAVLGGLQHAPDVGATLARLEADDFVSEGHRTILRAIEALDAQGRRADLTQLVDLLGQSGDLVAVGGPAYVASLDDDVIPSNLDGYIDRLKEYRALREAVVSTQRFLGGLGASVPARIPEVLAELESSLSDVANSVASGRHELFRSRKGAIGFAAIAGSFIAAANSSRTGHRAIGPK